jgi:hypothetical protein
LLNLAEEDLKRVWEYLVADRLMRRTSAGKWRKTVAFTNLLKDMGSSKSGYERDLPEDFEKKVYDRKSAAANDDSNDPGLPFERDPPDTGDDDSPF